MKLFSLYYDYYKFHLSGKG